MHGMQSPLPARLGTSGVRVRTLVAIRWMAIAGQSLTFAFVAFGLGFPIPVLGAVTAIAASAMFNIGLIAIYPRSARLMGTEALLHLGFDLVQLAVLLYLSGGLSNPFAVLLLVPVTISATLLSARATAVLVGIAIAAMLLLWNWSLPLPWAGVPPVQPPMLHLATLISLGFALVFLAVYVLRVSLDARRWQQALVTTQAVLERETKMSALGALAAAAAHELGGPLGTIALVARDLDAQLSGDPDFGDDVALLGREVRRCRDIMADLAHRAEVDAPFPKIPLSVLLHEAAQAFEMDAIAVEVHVTADQNPIVVRSSELLHGIVNLVDNAVRHAKSRVSLTGHADGTSIHIEIRDDGMGFPPDILPHLGEPFLGPSRSASGSTGLGIFIATTLLARTGGAIKFHNERGGVVDLTWPRGYIEAEDEKSEDQGVTP